MHIVWEDAFARLSMEKRKKVSFLHLTAIKSKPTWEEWRTMQDAVRKFYAQADASNMNMCLIFDLRNLGMLPLPMFHEWKELFDEVRPITKKIIHCSAMVLSSFIKDALVLFLKSYRSERKIYIEDDPERAIQACLSHKSE